MRPVRGSNQRHFLFNMNGTMNQSYNIYGRAIENCHFVDMLWHKINRKMPLTETYDMKDVRVSELYGLLLAPRWDRDERKGPGWKR